MDLEWVQAFLAVADTGSFSAAADALFLSQPVISKQVQKLELQLGVRLFDRAHRRAELTDAGRRAYPPAQALARQYQLLEQAVHPDGSLRLALLPVADCYGFPQMLADFSAAYPRTRLMVEERENTAMPALIQSGRCDGAFFRIPDGPVMPEDVILCKDELVLLVPEKLFCATKGAVPLSLFSGKRFLLLSAGTGLLETSLELCRKAGFSPQVGYTGAAAGNIARMVRSGAGVAMLSRRVAESCAGPDLRLLTPEPTCGTLLVFRPSKTGLQNPAMGALLKHLARATQ